ncbi:hypothetical protein [Chitinimonas sp. BJB300]|uniref:hypothetical protein n=1 Tax=Chitinimonas sp. BJB300 TaxID=1559339 RepID=UPI000C0F0306|nr:hypothetical protein [Chitinimonas sp. BJB300]PHV10993.1 hypothetical protein CSQ89_13285 [Chitinimonas sp. BJB300]TSJ87549.1 hypothetical protein FG002_013560 [Chitinimonas sp. BJB300]
MFGKKKDPYITVTCKGRKLDGHAVLALAVKDLELVEMVKKADTVEACSRVSFGRIYQKPGTMLAENNQEEQSYTARFDTITKSIGVNLRQGFMRQTLVLATKDPTTVCAELGLTLEVAGPSEPTVS